MLLGIVVHQESVCATFGSGLGSACIVDVGDQKTSVCCVEDGVSHRNTRYLFMCRIITSMYLITYQRLDFKKSKNTSTSTGLGILFLLWALQQDHYVTIWALKESSGTDTVLYRLFGSHDHSASKTLFVFLCIPQ